MKRQVAALTKTVAFLEGQEKRRVAEQPIPQKEAEDIRFRADGLKSHRAKLGLSAQDYGLLVGVTGQTIYDWESGQSRPRNKEQVAKVAAVRGIGIREALRRLDLLGGAGKRVLGKNRGQTAQQFVTALVKENKGITSGKINAAWTKAGRPGKADNTLSLMVKAQRLKRIELKGARGSTYRLQTR